MSLRSFGYTFKYAVAFGCCLSRTLSYLEESNRLRLLGIWLALLFNIASAEIAYVLIVIMSYILVVAKTRRSRRNFNLTVIWYLFPTQ